MPELSVIFGDIIPPPAVGDGRVWFSAVPLPELRGHRLAKDASGRPAILLEVAGIGGTSRPPPIVLENLSVQYDAECNVARPDGVAVAGRFTIVQCTSGDPALQAYFLRVAGAVVEALGAAPARADVGAAVESLAELFHALALPARQTTQGLWAELFVIVQAHEPELLLSAWHATPGDTYDFAAGTQRIDVKSSSRRARQHHFTLDQLQPPAETAVLIASLFVERAGAGVSIDDLVDEITPRLGGRTDLALHLDLLVGMALGTSWQRAMAERYDRELARESLQFYAAESIPAVPAPIPLEVSDVRFQSDLSGLDAVDHGEYRAMGGLFASAVR